MNNKEKIELINKTYSNTRFVIEENKFVDGIYKTISSWLLVLFISNLCLFLFVSLSQMIGFWGSEMYYKVHNVFYIILYCIPVIVYFFRLKDSSITLKERHFLYLFALVPVFISFSKLFYLISFFLNFDYLMSLYDSIPLDLIATIIGLLLLGNYFKDKKFFYVCGFVILYLLFFSFTVIVFLNTEILNNMIIFLSNFVNFINTYTVVILLAFLAALKIIKNNKHE